MSVISRLKVWIGSDTKDLEKGLDRGNKKVSMFSQGMKKIAGTIAAVFAVDQITSFAKACVNFNKKQVEAETNLKAVIKATNGAAGLSLDTMKRFASELQGMTKFGDEASIQAMVVLSTFKSVKGDIFKEAIVAAQDMSTVLKTDLQGSIIQIGKALESPTIGLTALRRSGVSFSDEQIAQIKKLVAEGKKQEAQLIVLKELQNEFGGAAKAAANDAFGAAVQAENAWGDLKEVIGESLTPSVDSMKNLTRMIQDQTAVIADKSIPMWKKWGRIIAGVAQKAMPGGTLLPEWNKYNVEDAKKEQGRQNNNQDEIAKLELRYKNIKALYDELDIYQTKKEEGAAYWKETIEAIDAEIKKRYEGVAATTKQKEAEEQLAADRAKAAGARKEAINEAAELEERSIQAIEGKIKAYQQLANTCDINDTKSQDYFTKEISRLQNLIAKTKELQNSRLLAEAKARDGGPLNPAPTMYGDKEAADDVRFQLTGGKETDLLPSKMQAATGQLQNIKGEMIDISDTVNGAFGDMAVGLGESLGALISGAGGLNGFAQLVAGTFADMAINVGKTAIQTGIAVAGIKAALKSLNPFAAIAAGVALVALGTLVKGSLGKIANGGSGSTGGTFSSNALSGNGITDTRTGNASEAAAKPIEVVINGQFKVRGSDLTAVLDNEGNRKNLTT